MSSFKLRGPSSSSLRDPANSTLRGSDGPLEFLKSLESILTATNHFQFQPAKAFSLVGALASSIKSSTIYTAFSSSLSTLSSFVRNVKSSRVSTLTGSMNSQSGVAHGVTVSTLSNLLNVQRQNQLSKNVALVNNSLFQKLNNVAINRILSTLISLIPTSTRFISFSIQSSFTNVFATNSIKFFNIVSNTSSTLVKNIKKSLDLSGSFATFLITPFTKFVELSLKLTSLFEGSIRKSVQNSLSLSTNLTSQFNKNLQILLENIDSTLSIIYSRSIARTLSLSSSTLTASLQNSIATLSSIQSNFNSAINNVVAKLITTAITTLNQMVAYLNAFISLSINNSLDPNILKNPNKLLDRTLTASIQIPRLTQASLSILASQSMNLLTQSLRFVSLAILSSQNVYKSNQVDFGINESAELLATVNKSPSIILEAVLTNFQLALNRLIAVNQTAPLTPAASLQNLVSSSFTLLFGSTLNLSEALFITINRLSVFASSIVRSTSKLVTVSINNLFDAALNKIIETAVNASTSLSNNFSKIINFSIGLTNSWSSLILTQSLRFVTFAINTNYTINFTRQLNKFIDYSNVFISTVQKRITHSLDVSSNFVASVVSNVIKLLSSSSVFNTVLKRSFAKYLNYSNIFDSFLSPGAFYDQFLEVTLTNTVAISTASLRFVSLAITSSYNQIISRLTAITKTVSFATVNSLLKRTSMNIVLSLSYSADIFNQAFRLVSLAVASAFNSTFALRIYSSTNINNNFNTTNQFSIFKTIDRIVNFNSNFNRSIRTALNVVSTFLSNLSRATSFNLSLNIISGFNNSISRVTSILLNNSLSTSLTDQKLIEFNRSISSNFIADIFYPSILRLMSLSVLAAQNVSLNNAISKTINRTYASVLNISRNSSILLQTTANSFVLTIQNSIQSSLAIAMNSLILFNKAINYEVPINLQGPSTLSRQISFALSQIINNSINLVKVTSTLVSANLNVLFDTTITKAVNYVITATVTLFNQFTNSINFTIRSINSFASLIFTQSFRFITLAIVSGQNVNNNFNVFNTVNNLATFTTNTTKLISATLSTIVSAPVLVIRKVVLSTINVGINFAATISNAIFYSIKAVAFSSSNIATTVDKTLTQTTEFASNIVKTTSALITASINSLFNSSIQRLVDFTQSPSLTANNNIQKSISFNIQLLNTFATFIFTQSFRFVSLAVTSGQNIAQQTRTFFSITTSNSLISNLSKNVGATLRFVFDNAVTQIQSSVAVSINLLANSAALIQKKVVSYNIKLNIESLLNISTRSFLALTNNLSLTSSVVKTTSALLTMTINNLFESSISRLTNVTINVINSTTVNFNRVIDFNLNLLSNISSLIFTQSLRFISLAILSNQNTAQQVLTSVSLNNLANLATALQNRILITIQSAWNSAVVEIKNVALPGIYVRINYVTTISKSISYSIVAGLQQGLNTQTSVFFALSSGVTLVSNTLKTTSSLITVAINNLFEANLSRLTNFLVDTTLTSSNSFSRSVNYSIKSINNFASLVFTQSFRFVTLAVLSGQDVAQQIAAFFTLNNTISLLAAIQRRTLTTIQSVWDSTILEIKNVILPGIYVRINYLASTQKLTSFSISATLTNIASWQTKSWIAMSRSMTLASNIFKTTSSLISVAVNNLFEASLQRLSSITVPSTFTTNNSFARSINFAVKLINNFSSLVLTQSLRFISLAIVSGQDLAIKVSSTLALRSTLSGVSKIQKSTVNTIRASFASTIIELKTVVLPGIYLYVNSVASINRSINYQINSLTSTIVAFSRSINFSININNGYMTLLVSSFNKLVNITISLYSGFEEQIQKLISTTLNVQSNFIVNFLKLISILISSILNTSVNVIKNIRQLLNNALITTLNQKRIIYSTFNFNMIPTLWFKKYIEINIPYSALQNPQLLFRSSFYITFNLISSFNSNLNKNIINTLNALYSSFFNIQLNIVSSIKVFINSNLLIARSIQKTINDLTFNLSIILSNISYFFISLNIVSFFETRLIKNTLFTLRFQFTLLINLQNRVLKTIKQVVMFNTSVFFLSYRFITLIVMNEWRPSFASSINRSIRIIFNNLTTLGFNSKIAQLLEVIINLPARRSHTLYSVLTSFAVNKSQPGSKGSAQQMQRKTGGSARKRNINNNSSTLFRRGKTDDLK